MGIPLLVDNDLDSIVSSDTFVPGKGVAGKNEEFAEIADGNNVKSKMDLATFPEVNMQVLAGLSVQESWSLRDIVFIYMMPVVLPSRFRSFRAGIIIKSLSVAIPSLYLNLPMAG